MSTYLPMVRCAILIITLLGLAPTSYAEQKNFHSTETKRFIEVMTEIKQNYIEPVDDHILLSNAIRGMVSRLDPHSTFLDKADMERLRHATTGRFAGIGIDMIPENGLIKIITPLDDGPAFTAKLKPGDYIIRINDMLVERMSLQEVVEKIRGPKGTQVELTILRPGKRPFEVKITRDIIKIKNIKAKLYDKHFAYIRITQFQDNTKKQFIKALETLRHSSDRSVQALILDLRNNPGGLLHSANDIANIFLNSTSLGDNDYIVYTKGRNEHINQAYRATPGDWLEGRPIVVLINAGSASASEIVAGALQDHHRAIIMGTKSFGKGSVQTVIPVSKDSAVKLTTHLYYTPMGHQIQAKGILPNVVVEDNLELAQKKDGNKLDPILEAQLNGHFEKSKRQHATTSITLDAQESKLAHQDYQLYQALNLVKGMALVHGRQ